MQNKNPFFEQMSGVMGDMAKTFEGMKREAETIMKQTAERILDELDVAKREDVDALEAKVKALEAQVQALIGAKQPATQPKTKTKATK